MKPDFVNQHCEFEEETDLAFPKPLTKEFQVTIFVDSNHRCSKATGKSDAGVIVLLGSIPVAWSVKRKSPEMTATFGAEFVVLKKAVEEAIVCRCCCRSLGMRVSKPEIAREDSMVVAINITEPGSALQNKCVP